MATTSPAGPAAGLARFNALMAAVHLVRAVALVPLSRDFRLPVTVSHLDSLVAKSALAWQVFAGTLRPV